MFTCPDRPFAIWHSLFACRHIRQPHLTPARSTVTYDIRWRRALLLTGVMTDMPAGHLIDLPFIQPAA